MKRGKLSHAALADRLLQGRVTEVAEKEKRPGLAIFLAHEQHRRVRRQEQQPGGQALLRWARKLVQPLAPGAVADLVVRLQADDELLAAKVAGGRAVLPAAKGTVAT